MVQKPTSDSSRVSAMLRPSACSASCSANSAFFLSRSYVVVLYLVAALVLAHYLELRRRDPELPDFALGRDALLWPLLSVGAVIGLYVLVKVLLIIQ